MPVLDIGQDDRAIESADVDMGIADIAYVNMGGSPFHGYISVQLLGTQRAGSGMQGHAGVGRHLHFVLDPPVVGVGPGEQMRKDVYPVAALTLVNLDLIGVNRSRHQHLVAGSRLHRNGTVLVGDRDAGAGAHGVAVFFAGRAGTQSHCGNDCHCDNSCGALPGAHRCCLPCE